MYKNSSQSAWQFERYCCMHRDYDFERALFASGEEKRALILGTFIVHLHSFVGSELTPECSFQKYSSGVVGEHVTGKRASRCTWTRAHPPTPAADAPRALNPLSFRGGEASARLSHRRVSSGCVRTKLHRRSSRRRVASLFLSFSLLAAG